MGYTTSPTIVYTLVHLSKCVHYNFEKKRHPNRPEVGPSNITTIRYYYNYSVVWVFFMNLLSRITREISVSTIYVQY